jgi:glycosyltransferase involved in cell wall biosynthesis
MQAIKHLETSRRAGSVPPGLPALPPATIRMPAVAAVVCNYNQKDFLEDAIASMLRQTYPYMEYVVVDDCSTDGSPEVILDVLARIGDGRVRFIRHEENRGQMAAMLSGLDATTAPFVAWLDADDMWFPEHIERHIAHHLNPQVNTAISTSNMAVVDAAGIVIAGADPSMSTTSPLRKAERSFAVRASRFVHTGEEIAFSADIPHEPVFINRNYEPWIWSPTSGMVFRRAAVEAIRPARSSRLRTSADHYLARFCHVVGGTIWIGETLGCYRVHGRNGFAKRSILGDGPIGEQPRHITEEGDYQFVLKLAQSEALTQLLPRRSLRRLLRKIGRERPAIKAILASRKLRRALRLVDRIRLLGRYAMARRSASAKA